MGTGSARSSKAWERQERGPGEAETERSRHPPPRPGGVSPGPRPEPPRGPHRGRPIPGVGKTRRPPEEGRVTAPEARIRVRGTRGGRPVIGDPEAVRRREVGQGSRRPKRGRQIPCDIDRVAPRVHRRVGREGIGPKRSKTGTGAIKKVGVRLRKSRPRPRAPGRGGDNRNGEEGAGGVTDCPQVPRGRRETCARTVIEPEVREEVAHNGVDETR